MSATLPAPYTGVLEDVHVTRIGQILGIPIAADATTVSAGFFEAWPWSVTVQRDALFDMIRAFEGNVQVESRVLAILRQWDALPLADETGVANKSRARLRDDLRAIYPVYIEPSGGLGIVGR